MPDVKLKGYSGNELEYQDVEKIFLAAPDSTPENPVLIPYTHGELLDGVEVEPDFSAGDMTVTVPEGYLVKSTVVKKPEALVAENIAKDVVVAGVRGTHEGSESGGGGEWEEAMKYFKCQIRHTEGIIVLYGIFFDLLYADTGSYEVTIPNTLCGMRVVIASEE